MLNGLMFNKDVTHPAGMKRRIENPRILLIDCPLEYKKGESATNFEITKETDFKALLEQEENEIAEICQHIIRVKPDLVIGEKGVSDLTAHHLMKADISVIRRLRKTDNLRIARMTGATICHRPEEITERDVGSCTLFDVRKIGDE